MAIWDLVADHESGVRVTERRAGTARRVLLCDDYLNAEKEAPQLGDPYPVNPKLRVVRVTVTGHGKPVERANQPDYELARVLVEYAYPSLVSDGQPIASHEHSIQVLDLSAGRVWASDGTDVGPDSPLNVLCPTREITLHQTVTQEPTEAITEAMGKVNSYPWQPMGLGYIYPAGSVLFLGCSGEQEFDAVYGIVYRLQFKFQYDPKGWNNIPRPSLGILDCTLPPVYDSASFASLGV